MTEVVDEGVSVLKVPEGTYHKLPLRKECSRPTETFKEPAAYKHVPLLHGYREAFMTSASELCANYAPRLAVVEPDRHEND
jgi:hypothetical protein